MANLSDSDRLTCSFEYIEKLNVERELLPLTKAQLKAAIDATDTWIDNNAASFNSALPTAARNNLSAKQKARLFLFVANKRFEIQ